MVVSDHGESLFEHDEPTHSYGIYDSTQRVPLLMQGPGLPRGRVVDAMVRLIDVAPTVLALSGAGPLPGATGRSLLAEIEGAPGQSPVAYLETLGTQFDMGWSPLLGIRTERHKYIRAPRPELYDLRSDPGETRNLAEDATGLVQELDALLATKLASGRPVRPNLSPSDDQRARLESLGYVLSEEQLASDSLGVVGGIDPKDEIGAIAARHEAQGLLEAGRPGEALARLEGIGDGFTVQLARASAALLAATRPAPNGRRGLPSMRYRATSRATPSSVWCSSSRGGWGGEGRLPGGSASRTRARLLAAGARSHRRGRGSARGGG